jgi:hypothetical protein
MMHPTSGKDTFDLFNFKAAKGLSKTQGWSAPQMADDFQEKNYQVMRNILFDRHTDKGKNITIPEILAYFGIKIIPGAQLQPVDLPMAGGLALPGLPQVEVFSLPDPTKENEFDPNNVDDPTTDDFGLPFIPTKETSSETGEASFVDAGGSVDDPDYAWAGASLDQYNVNLAKKMINLLFSDNIKNYRSPDLFTWSTSLDDPDNIGSSNWRFMEGIGLVTLNFAGGGDIGGNLWKFDGHSPPLLNVMSYVANNGSMGDLQCNTVLNDGPACDIFNIINGDVQESSLKLENYHLYILFLCLSGRVSYFQGFTSPPSNGNLTPTSYTATNQIKSKIWVPLSKSVLDNLPVGKILYCKVDLYDRGRWVDNKYVQMFLKYFNQNQYFYISRGVGEPADPQVVDMTGGSGPPIDMGPIDMGPPTSQTPQPDIINTAGTGPLPSPEPLPQGTPGAPGVPRMSGGRGRGGAGGGGRGTGGGGGYGR